MLKKLAVVGALAACSLAQAEVQELKVIYEGFYNAGTDEFDSWRRLTAYFDVEDINQDGTYSLDEVIEFHAGSVSYYGACSDHPVVENCLSSFSYTPGSNPSFTARYSVHDEMFYQSQSWVAGESYSDIYSSAWGGGHYHNYLWTEETKTWILPADAPAPIPEPSQYGMLAVGLAGIAALARRRRG